MKKEDYIKAMQELEPVFFEAGRLAVKLQENIILKTKLGTGVSEIDIVTNADTAVQELVLSVASKTILSQCRLVAEEKTESVDKFNPNGEFLLAIDPIDGTYRYADGGKLYSFIISLQSKGLPFYTFVYYPAFGWTHRFVNDSHFEEGNKPEIIVKKIEKAITYSYGDPKIKVPNSEIQKMEDRGYSFVNKKLLTSDCGATHLLLSGEADGFYCEEPLAVDGLLGLHYALAHGLEIHNAIINDWPKEGFGGIRYSNYYFIVRN